MTLEEAVEVLNRHRHHGFDTWMPFYRRNKVFARSGLGHYAELAGVAAIATAEAVTGGGAGPTAKPCEPEYDMSPRTPFPLSFRVPLEHADPELDAMGKILAILEPFGIAACRRITDWVGNRITDDLTESTEQETA